ncbi:MAG: maltooligosyltrehalose trehalohydrolase [Verrucomicrobiota bacterium]
MHQQTEPIPLASHVQRRARAQGAELTDHGVHYRTRSKHDRVEVVIFDRAGNIVRTVGLERESDRYFSGFDRAGAKGDLYKYRFGESQAWPDPASCYQPEGVHGPSMVTDPGGYVWAHEEWSRTQFSDLVIYELHVGTFTPEGTFRGAIARLPHLAALGVTAIELMPIADFPGDRNWGYDGVMLYAPARAYGTPDDLRALVDAAHGHGIAVILDVVYNHLGPDGNYLAVYDDGYYAQPRKETAWGAALDYEAPAVRTFFIENALYWMRDFRIDGFRLDATHAIVDNSARHLLAEIAEAVQAEGGFVIAEDERNEAAIVAPRNSGGWGFNGVWADDFHHVVRTMLTGEREGYYGNFDGSGHELAQTITRGWLYRGQPQLTSGERRGTDPSHAAPEQFVYCISNHDQVGNRAFGERLNQNISAAAYRAASALLCLVPQTPMLFMGQEWAASTPFQFFTDHKDDLGQAITKGRRREFKDFSAFRDPRLLETIPDPQSEQTFFNSKLTWNELESPAASATFLLYSEFLRARRTSRAFQNRKRDSYVVLDEGDGIVAILFGPQGDFTLAVVANLLGVRSAPNMDDARLSPGQGRDWKAVLSSNEERFGGNGSVSAVQPGTVLFEAF